MGLGIKISVYNMDRVYNKCHSVNEWLFSRKENWWVVLKAVVRFLRFIGTFGAAPGVPTARYSYSSVYDSTHQMLLMEHQNFNLMNFGVDAVLTHIIVWVSNVRCTQPWVRCVSLKPLVQTAHNQLAAPVFTHQRTFAHR